MWMRVSFCSLAKFFRTNFAHTFRMFNSSVKNLPNGFPINVGEESYPPDRQPTIIFQCLFNFSPRDGVTRLDWTTEVWWVVAIFSPFCEQFVPLLERQFWHDMIAVYCLQGPQCFLSQFSPLNEKIQHESLFEVIRTRLCVYFCTTALHTNVHYTTTNTQITAKLGTVVPDPPCYNICLFSA